MLIPASLMGQAKHSGYVLPDEPKRAKYIDFPSLDKGLWFAVQVTGAAAFCNVGNGAISQLDLVAGYRFGEFLKLGLGVSPQFSIGSAGSIPFHGINNSPTALPVYLDLRGNIISQESRMAVPYWNLDAGYSFGEGLYLSPTVGVRVGQPRNNFIAGLTYIFQNVAVYGTSFSAVGIRLGYEF